MTESELKKTAAWFGVKSLYEEAIIKIKEGLTTCDEVLRVLGSQKSLSITCPQCEMAMDEKHPNCPYCGFEIMPICPSCSKTVIKTWSFCPGCRHNLKGKPYRT